ncbi:glycosyltransferase family 2 protein [Microbacterium sp. Marseille-Q6965]|uniref:glycosyltransferase family 2 protein n=1 Tax=Microbacterium sp. Marseille-Q6965 TaxID=2965072 RepID=UPI0021B6F9C9|nr:glycosyltransferase family 2 protein [Microbacterium sp. Marseille-Q6965]
MSSDVPVRAPLLSVVMPTHNVGPWVRETLRSILAQDLTDLEVLVVDDHSTDATRDVVRAVVAEDARVRLIEANRRGGGSARNEGVAVARGEFLVFSDGDDIVPDGAYSALVDSLRESGSDIAFGDYLKFRPVDTWRPTDSMAAFSRPSRGITLADEPTLLYSRPCWNKAFRRDWWLRNGLSFPDVPRSNDIVPMVRAYLAARRVDIVSAVVYLYRERPGVSSMTARADSSRSILSYLEQERICAELVSETQDEGLMRVYAGLVYDRDGFVHIAKYLSRWEAPSPQDADVAAALQRLLAVSPRPPRHVHSFKRLALQLAANGEFEAARVLAAPDAIEGQHPRVRLRAWATALQRISAHDLWRAGDHAALTLPLASALTAPQAATAAHEWKSLVAAVRSLFGDRELMLVPEASAHAEEIERALAMRDQAAATVGEILGGRGGLTLTGSSELGGGTVRPVLYDGEFAGNPPVEPSTVAWRRSPEGGWDWTASFRVGSLPLHRPLTPALRAGDVVVSVRSEATVPEYDRIDPFLYDPFGPVVMIRRRRHWVPRAARRVLLTAAGRIRSLLGSRSNSA